MTSNTAFQICGFSTWRLEVCAENKPAVDLGNTSSLYRFLQKIDEHIGFCFVLPQEGTPLILVVTKAIFIARDKIDSLSI